MSLEDLIEDRLKASGAAPEASAYAGIIADTASSPTSSVRVIIPEFSNSQTFGPAPWMPRGMLYPTKGDKALVVIDSDNEPWIVMWTPYD
jgi:hypothetical protein